MEPSWNAPSRKGRKEVWYYSTMLQKPTLNSGSIAIPITKPNKVVPNEINGLHPIFLPYCLSETIETRENATVEFPRL